VKDVGIPSVAFLDVRQGKYVAVTSKEAEPGVDGNFKWKEDGLWSSSKGFPRFATAWMVYIIAMSTWYSSANK
jgi:hypothetical protein